MAQVCRYPAYPAYKPSGVEWLGDIPEGWSAARLKNATFINMGQSPSSEECNADGNGRPFLQGNAEFGVRYPTPKNYCETAKKVASEGELLFSVRAPVGALNIANQDYGIGRGLCSISPNSLISRNFLWWILVVAKSQLNSVSTGSTFEAVSAEQVGNCFLAMPSFLEQTTIAAFLTHETAKIDALIGKQQRLIALLEEKRQAVISHAVTRGLDPTAPLRPSGIDWLGDVPAHWEVVHVKHLCEMLKDGTHLPPARVDEGIPLLSVRNIINGKFGFREDDSKISQRSYAELCKPFVPAKGDILLAIVGGTIGKVAVVEEMKPFHIQRSLAIFRTNAAKMSSGYMSNAMASSQFQSLLWANVGFSAQPGIYLGALANFQLPHPPLAEQNEINGFCQVQSRRFTQIISKAKSGVILLKERRTALISAAVTGKIDLRDWQPPEGATNLSNQDIDQTEEALA